MQRRRVCNTILRTCQHRDHRESFWHAAPLHLARYRSAGQHILRRRISLCQRHRQQFVRFLWPPFLPHRHGMLSTGCMHANARARALVLSPPLMISLLFFHSMACCEGRARGRPSAERVHHDVRDRQGGRLALRIKTQPQGLAHTVPREPADYPRRAGSVCARPLPV